MKPIVIFYRCGPGSDAPYTLALNEQGYRVIHCADTATLRREAGKAARVALPGNEPVVAVLAAGMPQNRAGASILAAMPRFGVVIMPDSFDDASLTTALQLGVDAWCPRQAAPQVLALVVQCVMRRLEQNNAGFASARNELLACPAPAPLPWPDTQWQLDDRAWVLRTPAGKQVRLTYAERCFMLELIRRPGLSATHADLGVACGNTAMDAAVVKSRLGVLVSRLRRKVAQHGADLPVQSLYKLGYMFSGDIAADGIESNEALAGGVRPPRRITHEGRRKKTMLSR